MSRISIKKFVFRCLPSKHLHVKPTFRERWKSLKISTFIGQQHFIRYWCLRVISVLKIFFKKNMFKASYESFKIESFLWKIHDLRTIWASQKLFEKSFPIFLYPRIENFLFFISSHREFPRNSKFRGLYRALKISLKNPCLKPHLSLLKYS